MRIKAYAKINLALDIVGRRSDGYHVLDMVMHTISLHDTLTIKRGTGDFRSLVQGRMCRAVRAIPFTAQRMPFSKRFRHCPTYPS